MTPQPNPERRSERARRAILDAVFEVAAAKGYGKVTIEAIAAAAGVGKPTIYRWWPSKGAVALDAVNDRIGDSMDFPDTGDIAADLTAQLTAVATMLTGDIGTIYRGIIAEAQSDPGLAADLRATMLEPRIQRCVRRLDAAVAAGQLRADLPARTMVDILYAPVYYRILLGAGPDETLRSPLLVRTVLEGLRPAAA
ncbi:TetR/AcrR family transcriptional regulator [Kitasatospora aureofaciens]|uniref:TetR/AcrR family transcriptional regulator n=1 Tax=Kitasatospora aureofaciens TaxID=1894 RepID=UPI001C43CCD4|nr:TetR/AcrR family transcriptional regulator [Kitasatospora aureofaciens]MBV6702242.1 TetR/AcrR family transcriptional regulator [Kitasatospora aureofaciens]